MNPLYQSDVLAIANAAHANEHVRINKPAARRLLDVCEALATDLLDLHNRTGISLDNWESARTLVEAFKGPITENHA
jgi:hypothetical protein